MKTKHFSIIGTLILCMLFLNVKAQSSTDDKEAKESARVFVQQFYDWYNAGVSADTAANKNAKRFNYITAITQKPGYFDAPLLKVLINDNEAQSKSDEVVGLDFDPFLNAQDVGFKYTALRVKQDGEKFYVNVHTTNAAKSNSAVMAFKLTVIAEVVKTGGNWQFVNFLYPSKDGRTDLLSILNNSAKNSGEKKSQ